MKVGILSRHSVANYGSLFQAYALQSILEKLGYEAVNINYTPSGEIGGNLAKTLVGVSRWGKNPISKFLFYCYQFPSCMRTFNAFKEFRKKYLKETKEYTSSAELKYDLPDVDLFCTGSDQVWNLLYDNRIDDTYFFDFLPDEARRIAYAASFGGNKFENKNVGRYIQYLKKYDAITVRENSGIEILKSFGIQGEQVLDPTLLLNEEDWRKIIPDRRKESEYILIYQLRPNKAFDEYARELAKQTGLKLIRISVMYFQKVKCGKFLYLPRPEEFLWYIKNANCLLTDSFHGTCFAINFRTPFIEILPGRFNARNQSLLKTMGVENRILEDYSDFSLFENEINWSYVNELHAQEKQKSISQLRMMIDGGNYES